MSLFLLYGCLPGGLVGEVYVGKDDGKLYNNSDMTKGRTKHKGEKNFCATRAGWLLTVLKQLLQ
jgi:hypothetical protein